jgi:hypothetical protein
MISVAFFSCGKDDYYWGTFTAKKNGDPWIAEIRTTNSSLSTSKININIHTISQSGEVLEKLSLFKVPATVGLYRLSYTFNQPPDDSLVGCIYSNGYQDQLIDSYLLSPNDSTSYLEITAYDSKTKEIEGRFSLIVWPFAKGSWNAPDSIVFSNGAFHTRIQE